MAAQSEKTKIVICGAGNAAHIFVGLAGQNANNEVHLLSLYATEAEDFKTAMNKTADKKLTVTINKENRSIQAVPANITNDPSCLNGADIIIISLPAFAHGQYLQAMKDNIKLEDDKKRVLVSAWPGGAGLECEWSSILGKNPGFVLMSGRTLPWAARITTFGQGAEILGTKDQIEAALAVYDGKNDPAQRQVYFDKIQKLIGAAPKIVDTGHIFNMSLSVVGSIVHPSIMYAKWRNFDGKALTEKPLFYQGITEEDAKLMEQLSAEIITIIESVEKETGLTLLKEPIFGWYKNTYGSSAGDSSTLYKLITTNPGYNGLTHPMIEVEEKQETRYLPNYNYRYLAQDIPYGLLVIRGFSLILDEKNQPKVPLIDAILQWAQKMQEKEYFKYNDDGTIVAGKDVQRTRAPQRYDIKSIKDLL
mmetsp:Transcript_2661/g.5042  ORF Transcript_2661/g.5042 Transcript_2661/m.5042 type:complete len:420 (+) Transcript_2661:100-1359(+)|eukprot:CAMPEP_0202685434 /NCGR_PEP_ID=MMETSP1385-20130828/1187_1 /ASSEMBLY_ACC=CAM_ASM_000861 /TAXON_ID=933848 /ORGANISM="Elphidium margaritaceum" /LENGTH=419 /DNA_ID=CAMNT_0049339775 /DNA_START=67 /DNA_END=1326 /DNA_ORIENTATION=-